MEALIYLTYIAVLLLIGIICSIISNKFKIPNIILLILAGISLRYLPPQLISTTLSTTFLAGISIIALVMILFDSTSRLKLKTFDSLSIKSLKLASISLLFNILFLTIPVALLYRIEGTFSMSIILALIFTTLVSATDSASVAVLLKGIHNKLAKLLQIESIVNTPLAIIFPLMLLDLFYNAGEITSIPSLLVQQIAPFLGQIIIGIGSGVFIGLIIFKLMKRKYSEQLSPIAIITAALLTYILAQNLGGSGVIAVVALGLFFGNIHLERKESLFDISSVFSNFLEILVFILIGFSINLQLSWIFLIKSLFLFLLYLLIRFLAVKVTFGKEYSFKEQIFLSLNVSKGIAVAVIAFTLMTKNMPSINSILPLILIFMVYSIALATITEKNALKLIKSR